MSKSDSEIDENSDVAPGGRNNGKNSQDTGENFARQPEPGHAVVDSDGPPVNVESNTNLTIEKDSQRGPMVGSGANRNSLSEGLAECSDGQNEGLILHNSSGTDSGSVSREKSGSRGKSDSRKKSGSRADSGSKSVSKSRSSSRRSSCSVADPGSSSQSKSRASSKATPRSRSKASSRATSRS